MEENELSPGWIMITGLCLINEIIDWVGALLNVTGVWAVIILIINLVTLFFVLGWRFMSGGFSFSALFGGWKQVLFLIVEHIPIVGDIFPGWLLFMMGIRGIKKKREEPEQAQAPKPSPKPAKKLSAKPLPA